jgi:hypothetical protein
MIIVCMVINHKTNFKELITYKYLKNEIQSIN